MSQHDRGFLRGIWGAKTMGIVALAISATASICSPAQAASGDSCDRQCLIGIADGYFSALAAHDPSRLPVAANVKFAENNAVLKLGEGHWKGGGKETYRMQIFDPEQGGIGILAVIPATDGPAVMVLRLKVERRLISEVEAIVVYKGKDSLVVPEHLAGTKPSFYWTRTLRPAERNNRYELMGAAEAYWIAFQSEGSPDYVPAPLMPDTVRTENGAQTTLTTFPVSMVPPGQRARLPKGQTEIPTGTAAEQFDSGTFKGLEIHDRRYPVVDVQVGAVLSMARFADPHLVWVPKEGKVVGEFFAVTQGKIGEIAAAYTVPTKVGPSPWQ